MTTTRFRISERSPRRPAGILAAAAVAVGLILVGCGSGGADVDAPADVAAAPAAPAKKPFEPPSWDSAVYTNDELGFSVHYPSDFAEQPPQGGLFTAASPAMVPRIDVNAGEAPDDASLDSVIEVVAEGLGQAGGGEATVKESQQTTLRDGVTPAIEGIIDWSFQGFPLQSFVVGAIEGGSVITVTVTGMQGGDVAELSDIAYTLYFD